MWSNGYDDVTYFKVSGFIKNSRSNYLENETFLQLKKKNYHEKKNILRFSYFMGKSFHSPNTKYFIS